MPYIGQRPATGEANSFKILDEISSYTLTFDGSSAGVGGSRYCDLINSHKNIDNGTKLPK